MNEFEGQAVDQEGVDRRRFLKKAAVTAAWATPVLMTLSAKPAFAQPAGSCGTRSTSRDPVGSPCANITGACATGLNCLTTGTNNCACG